MKQFLVLLTFAIISMAVSPLRMLIKYCGGFEVCLAVWFILNFITMVFFIKRYKDKLKPTSVLLFGLIGTVIVLLPVVIYGFPHTVSSSLGMLGALCGALAGFMFTKVSTKTRKIIFIVVCLALVVLLSTYIRDIWVDMASSLTK